MVQRFGTPYFGKLGETERHRDLTVGVYDNEVRRVVELVNTTGTDIQYRRGQILFKGPTGVIVPADTNTFDDITYTVLERGDHKTVENEAVGSGNGTTTVFWLQNPYVAEASFAMTVNSVATTSGFTLDRERGRIVFASAPTNGHAIVATYNYYEPAEDLVFRPLVNVVPLVAEVDVTVPKKVGETNGAATLNVLVKAEVAKDMLRVGDYAWKDLPSEYASALENWMTLAGLIPADVVR